MAYFATFWTPRKICLILCLEGMVLAEKVLENCPDFVPDASGNLVGVYQGDYMYANAAYDGFGKVLDSWNMSTFTNFTWGGGYGYRQTDLAYSSVYVRARHYSNLAAGWTTRDPLWPSEMPYGYVNGRVPGRVDPSGMIVYTTKGCDGKMQTAILYQMKKLNSIMQDSTPVKGINGSESQIYDGFIECLTGREGTCEVIPGYSREPWGTLKNPLMNNDFNEVNLEIRCVNCEPNPHPVTKKRKCAETLLWSINGSKKVIEICKPYVNTPRLKGGCGPIMCTILHEMIHAYIHLKDVGSGQDPDQAPWGCLDWIPGCMGER
jgi:hypothetical protein